MPISRLMIAVVILAGLALSACTVGGGSPERTAGASSSGAPSPEAVAPSHAATPGTSSSSPTGDRSTPEGTAVTRDRCRTAQLKVDAGQVQAAASTRSLVLQLTNISDTRCTITGFGGLALLDASGTQLPTRFERAATQPRTVELAPQGYTTRTINWRVVPAQNTDPTTDCVSGETLLVTPPDEDPANLVVHEPITACRGGTITGTPWDRDAG